MNESKRNKGYLYNKRIQIIRQLYVEKYSIMEIRTIFNDSLTKQRIYQIITNK